MSVWKKAAKANQKTHRERHQPEAHKHLGLLEKKKDYVKRARDYNEKKETLKLLRRRALNRNPDEFYHHMINSKINEGVHREKETEEEDTPEQIQLMRSQDLRYVTSKRTQELRKIEKLQSQLHLTSVNLKVNNKHVRFPENINKNDLDADVVPKVLEKELPDFERADLELAAKKRKKAYLELAKRINREKELSVIQQKIEIQRHIDNKRNLLPPKRVRKGSKDNPPVYVWKYERKK